MPKAGGGWTEKILHGFNTNDPSGYGPYSGLILNKAGDLYGANYEGGANGYGTVYEIKP